MYRGSPLRNHLFVTLLCLTLLLGTLNLGFEAESSPKRSESPQQPTEPYLVQISSSNDIDTLESQGVTIFEAYETFIMTFFSQDQKEYLTGMGHLLTPVNDLFTISFDTISFDTRDGEPDLPPTQRMEEPRQDERAPYIIQLKGPVKMEWVREIEKTGAEVLDSAHHFAYLVEMTPRQKEMVMSLEFVRWSGLYHPAYRWSGTFNEEGYFTADGDVRLTLTFFKAVGSEFQDSLVTIRKWGGEITTYSTDSSWWDIASITIGPQNMERLAALPGLKSLSPLRTPSFRNDVSRWVIQDFDTAGHSTPIWDHGITGEGVVIGIADSGIDLDHIMFRHNDSSVGVPGPDHRKIVRYNSSIHDWDDSLGHGTHVAGSAAGDSTITPGGYDQYDGMAYGAKIAFYDIATSSGTFLSDPPYMDDILLDAYLAGARTHSDSWGDDVEDYTTRAEMCDQFQWDHYDFQIFIAPGNVGGMHILEPATAKNVVGVGCSYNGNTKNVLSYSHGPTKYEGLMSPTIFAPGYKILSALGDTQRDNFNGGQKEKTGTSMSTPIAAGGCALVEQYFKDGFYPSGAANPTGGFNPSGPLKKAVLVNSGWDQYPGANTNGYHPNGYQGWGKIKLDDALYFQGDSQKLWVDDLYNESGTNPGLATGQTMSYYQVVSSDRPLEVTVVWNDWPGAFLRNDLNLVVTDPNGNTYRGNNYSLGQSYPNGLTADTTTPIETFYLQNPTQGLYTINITAANIASGIYQPFSIVVTGNLTTSGIGVLRMDRPIYTAGDMVNMVLFDSNLTGAGSVGVTVSSDTETTPEPLNLQETSPPGKFIGSILLSSASPASDGIVSVSDTDLINVKYQDSSPPQVVEATALIDLAPPMISNINVELVTNSSAYVCWSTNEWCTGEVHYGTDTNLGHIEESSVSSSYHRVKLTGLSPQTPYLFEVLARDSVSLTGVDNNGGLYNHFTTYTYAFFPKDGYVGWVNQNENFNHFLDDKIFAGISNNQIHFGGLQFDLSDMPRFESVTSAQIRLYGLSDSLLLTSASSFSIQVMNSSVDQYFNGTATGPNFTSLSDALVACTVGTITSVNLVPGEWNILNLGADCLEEIEMRARGTGKVSFRIDGPTMGPNNLFSWSSGKETASPEFTPQLVLSTDPGPEILPTAPNNFTMYEDTVDTQSIHLDEVFQDNGSLSYSWSGYPPGIESNLSLTIHDNGSIWFTPNENWNGEETIRLMATDPSASSAYHKLDISVLPVNDPPMIVSIGGVAAHDGMVLNATQDEIYSVHVDVSDVDMEFEGNVLEFSNSPEHLVLFPDPMEGYINFTPSNDQVGDVPITLTVSDYQLSDSLALTLHVENVNDPPLAVITSPSNLSLVGYVSGTPIFFNGTSSYDPDLIHGDSLTFIWFSNRSGQFGSESSFAHTFHENGPYRISLKVTDVHGQNSTASVVIILLSDLDGDGIPDRNDTDMDGDGMPDLWELLYDLDPRDPLDGSYDPDEDNLTNVQEYLNGTHPKRTDSDGDDIPDGWEVLNGLDPLDQLDAQNDPDEDGYTNIMEYENDTDPNKKDGPPGEVKNGNGESGGFSFLKDNLALVLLIICLVITLVAILVIRLTKRREMLDAQRAKDEEVDPKEYSKGYYRSKWGSMLKVKEKEKEEEKDEVVDASMKLLKKKKLQALPPAREEVEEEEEKPEEEKIEKPDGEEEKKVPKKVVKKKKVKKKTSE